MTAKRISKRTIVVTTAVATLSWFALFDIRLAPRFSMPSTEQVADAAQEGRYRQCFEQRDERIHAQAFGTIDNPDVQKEYINAERLEAEALCRERHPRIMTTVRTPFEVNLVDAEFRFD